MKTITDKDIFLKVKNHLLTQNKKSLNPEGACSYRARPELNGETGPLLMCAVGCIIDKNWYNTELENASVYATQVEHAVVKSNPEWNMGKQALSMLEKLQGIHDSFHVWQWKVVLDEKNWVFAENGEFKYFDNMYYTGIHDPWINKYPISDLPKWKYENSKKNTEDVYQ